MGIGKLLQLLLTYIGHPNQFQLMPNHDQMVRKQIYSEAFMDKFPAGLFDRSAFTDCNNNVFLST